MTRTTWTARLRALFAPRDIYLLDPDDKAGSSGLRLSRLRFALGSGTMMATRLDQPLERLVCLLFGHEYTGPRGWPADAFGQPCTAPLPSFCVWCHGEQPGSRPTADPCTCARHRPPLGGALERMASGQVITEEMIRGWVTDVGVDPARLVPRPRRMGG